MRLLVMVICTAILTACGGGGVDDSAILNAVNAALTRPVCGNIPLYPDIQDATGRAFIDDSTANDPNNAEMQRLWESGLLQKTKPSINTGFHETGPSPLLKKLATQSMAGWSLCFGHYVADSVISKAPNPNIPKEYADQAYTVNVATHFEWNAALTPGVKKLAPDLVKVSEGPQTFGVIENRGAWDASQ